MINRRQLLKVAATCIGAVVFAPQVVFAAMARKGFGAEGIKKSVKATFGTSTTIKSNKVILVVPTIAENGAIVPVTIKTTLAKPEAMAIFVDANPAPLAASFPLNSNMKPEISTRVKMRGSSLIRVVVKSEGKLYTTSKEVKVTLGGCGG